MNGVCATGTWDKALIGYNWEKASQFVVHGPHLSHEFKCQVIYITM